MKVLFISEIQQVTLLSVKKQVALILKVFLKGPRLPIGARGGTLLQSAQFLPKLQCQSHSGVL